MTLLALMTRPYPILVGDLAITSLRRGRVTITSIPSLGKNLPAQGKLGARYLTGLEQKLVVVNPYSIVGWAGDRIAARMVLRLLREKFGDTPLEPGRVGAFMDELGYKNGKIDGLDLSLLGLSRLPNGEIKYFGCGEHRKLTKDGYEFHLMGSGADRFSSWILRPQIINNLDDAPEPFEALARSIGMTALAIMEELWPLGGLRDFFGGFFECAIATSTGITKVGDVTYGFWFFKDFDKNGMTMQVPPIFLKTAYVGEHLVVRRLRITSGRMIRELPMTHADLETFVVASPLANSIDRATARAAMGIGISSRILCTCFVFMEQKDPSAKPTVALSIAAGEEKHCVTFEEKGRRLLTRLDSARLSALLSGAEAVLRPGRGGSRPAREQETGIGGPSTQEIN